MSTVTTEHGASVPQVVQASQITAETTEEIARRLEALPCSSRRSAWTSRT